MSLVAYLAIFALFATGWLLAASRGVPRGFLANGADERLVVWILAWVAHALGSGTPLFDANINHPAPAQLTGSEHFLTAQTVFAPLYALTDNPLLAANLTAFLTYPLAALAMQRLLLALGCGGGAASVVGLLFALGPFRVPGHLHLLQYSNLFLPWVGLALTRLRDRPDRPRAALLAVALGAAALSSYYTAVLAGVVAVAWGTFELLRPAGSRRRFVVLAGAAALVVAVVFLLVSQPYLSRPEAANEGRFSLERSPRQYLLGAWAVAANRSGGDVALLLAGLGVVGLLARDATARACAQRGLVLTVLAQMTAVGAALPFDEIVLPTPFALVATTPLRFFRYPMRFAVVVGFGTSLLAAALLQTVTVHAGRRVGRVAVAALAVAIVVTRLMQLSGRGTAEFAGQIDPVYDVVERVTRARGRGPLLELPIVDPLVDEAGVGTEVDSMVGSTRHWLPLVAGFTAYQPPHRSILMRLVEQLPDEQAVQRLVDLTHVRWILLRPVEQWPERSRAQRESIRTSEAFRETESGSGWVLLRVKAKRRSDKWYDAIAAGPQPDRTLLGTPLAPLPEDGALAELGGVLAPTMTAGKVGPLVLGVRNAGTVAWPVSVPPRDEASRHLVRLVLQWWPVERKREGEPVATQSFGLPIDLEPDDLVTVRRWVKAPGTAGEYDVRLRIEQVDGATFTTGENKVLDTLVRVVAEGP